MKRKQASSFRLYREEESSPYTRRRWRWGIVTDLGNGQDSRCAIGSRRDALERLRQLRKAESDVRMFREDERLHGEARARAGGWL